MTLRVTSSDTDPWEGAVSELLDAQPELPELVRRRIETLPPGAHIEPEFAGTRFRIARLS